MKQYHEVAHCKNAEGKITYLVLSDINTNRYEYVTWERFEELVKEELVQYFIWDYYENKPMVHYSEEELKSKGKSGKKAMEIINNTEEYFAKDVVFSADKMELLLNDNAILAAACLPVKIPFVGAIMPLLLIGSSKRLAKFVSKIPDNLGATTVEHRDGILYLQLSEMIAKAGLYQSVNFDSVIVDFTTLDKLGYNQTNLIKDIKPLSILKGASNIDCASIIALCDEINKTTFATLSNATSNQSMDLF